MSTLATQLLAEANDRYLAIIANLTRVLRDNEGILAWAGVDVEAVAAETQAGLQAALDVLAAGLVDVAAGA